MRELSSVVFFVVGTASFFAAAGCANEVEVFGVPAAKRNVGAGGQGGAATSAGVGAEGPGDAVITAGPMAVAASSVVSAVSTSGTAASTSTTGGGGDCLEANAIDKGELTVAAEQLLTPATPFQRYHVTNKGGYVVLKSYDMVVRLHVTGPGSQITDVHGMGMGSTYAMIQLPVGTYSLVATTEENAASCPKGVSDGHYTISIQ